MIININITSLGTFIFQISEHNKGALWHLKADLIDHKKERERLCQERVQIASTDKSAPWTLEDLEVVLKELKCNKSRDPLGFSNELFKYDILGEDLKNVLLHIMNRIKSELKLPVSLRMFNVSCLWKRKHRNWKRL